MTVVPSRAEGFSLPIIEALYCDCPVILSDISAHRELVEFEDALFQFDDGVTLTSLFNRFLNESPLRGEWLAIQKQKSLVFDENAVARKVWEHVGSFCQRGKIIRLLLIQIKIVLFVIKHYSPSMLFHRFQTVGEFLLKRFE